MGHLKNSWLASINKILDTCGFSNIWCKQGIVNEKWITNAVRQRLKDQFIQTWSSDVFNSSKSTNYRLFKTKFGPEIYLENLPVKFRNIFMKFRTTNHHLPVETGRWFNVHIMNDCVNYVMKPK